MSVKAKGFKATKKKIADITDMRSKRHKRAMERVTQQVVSDNIEYPPSTAANRPPTPFYIRGRGLQLKRGNKLNSEDLLHRWDTKVKASRDSIVGYVLNTASYAAFVVGDRQAWFHALRGWPNVYVYVRRKRRDLAELYGRVYKNSAN